MPDQIHRLKTVDLLVIALRWSTLLLYAFGSSFQGDLDPLSIGWLAAWSLFAIAAGFLPQFIPGAPQVALVAAVLDLLFALGLLSIRGLDSLSWMLLPVVLSVGLNVWRAGLIVLEPGRKPGDPHFDHQAAALEREKERITEVQEEARRRMARDLHDGPTQSLAAIAMRLNYARRLLERDGDAALEELQKVENLARTTTKELRHMLFTLRPLILESQGLVAALFQLAAKIKETHDAEVIVDAEERVAAELDLGVQSILFFIAEEAISNAQKHAEAETIWVRIFRQDGMLVLEVEDNGVGFNLGAIDADYAQRGSLGMVNMRERSELVAGQLDVISEVGQGTQVSVRIPLTS